MAAIVQSLLMSLRGMQDIFTIIAFVIMLFGIFGMQFYQGPSLHARCRLTPYPVNTSWVPGAPFEPFRCLIDGKVVPNYDYSKDYPDMNKDSSPWAKDGPHRKKCFWPLLYQYEPVFCNVADSHADVISVCLHDKGAIASGIKESDWSWCGGSFDAWGNERFEARKTWKDTFSVYLSYGYCNFDNFGNAILFVFQLITGAGWVDLMYLLMGGVSAPGGAIFSVILLIIGTFFIVELIIAIFETTVVESKALEKRQARKEKMMMLSKAERKLELYIRKIREDREALVAAGAVMSLEFTKEDLEQFQLDYTAKEAKKNRSMYDKFFDYFFFWDDPELAWRVRIRKLLFDDGTPYQHCITGLIVVNTIVMSCDRYPISISETDQLAGVTFILTIFFLVDMVLKLAAVGWRDYWKESFTAFDGVVVAMSMLDLGLSPVPVCLGGPPYDPNSGAGSLSAMRSFRLLRLLRLFKARTFKVNDLYTHTHRCIYTFEF